MAKDYDAWESMFAEPSGSDGGWLGTIALALAGIGISGGVTYAVITGLQAFGKDSTNKPIVVPRHTHDAENLPIEKANPYYRASMLMQEHLSKGHSSWDDKDVRLDEAVFELSQKVKALNEALEKSKNYVNVTGQPGYEKTFATYENLHDLELRAMRDGQSARYELEQKLSANLDSSIMLMDKEYWRNQVEDRAAIRDLQAAFLHHLPTSRIEDGASYTAPGSNLFGQTFENGHPRIGEQVANSGWRNGHKFSNKHGEWKASWYKSSLDPNFEGYQHLWYPPWMESWQGHQFERFDHRKMHELNRNHSNIGVGIFRNSLNANQVQPGDWPGGEQRMRNAENEISNLESRYTRNIYGQDGLRQYAMNHEKRISNLEDALA